MGGDKQSKLKRIDGGASEVKPPAVPRPMQKWQWMLLWIAGVFLWFLLFYNFWIMI